MSITTVQRKKMNSKDKLERITGTLEISQLPLAKEYPIVFEMLALLGNEVIALKQELKELEERYATHCHTCLLD